MNIQEYGRLKAGDMVTYSEGSNDENFPWGWGSSLDLHVGKSLRVYKILRENDVNGVEVVTSKGHHYTIASHLLKKVDTSFVVNEYKYFQSSPISLRNLHKILLIEDFVTLTKVLPIPEEGLVLSLTKYNLIKRNSPKVIGALLGNKILKKEHI